MEIHETIQLYKLLVLDRNTWNLTTKGKLFVLDKNTSYHNNAKKKPS